MVGGGGGRVFTLQNHPSRLVFSSDGGLVYMAMDIDPNSEENEARRPAFLVYLDLAQNQLPLQDGGPHHRPPSRVHHGDRHEQRAQRDGGGDEHAPE